MILGTQGIDTVSGVQRFTFGINEFYEGVGILPVIMGIYGVGEILVNLEETLRRDVFKVSIKGLLPDRRGLEGLLRPDHARDLPGVLPRDPPGLGDADFDLRLLHHGEAHLQDTPSASGTVRSKGWPARRRPTTRPPPAPSSRS